MKKSAILVLIITEAIFSQVFASDGIINIQSKHSAEITMSRLKDILESKGMTIFTTIKHSEAARKNNVSLRHTELLIFGNPKVGSPLMACSQKTAIDLPQKALIWEDDKDNIWISYNDPRYLKKRHNIDGCDEVVNKIENALKAITSKAASN